MDWLTWLGQGLKKILQSLVCLSSVNLSGSWGRWQYYRGRIHWCVNFQWPWPVKARFFKPKEVRCFSKSLNVTPIWNEIKIFRYILFWFTHSWFSPLADCFEIFCFVLVERTEVKRNPFIRYHLLSKLLRIAKNALSECLQDNSNHSTLLY